MLKSDIKVLIVDDDSTMGKAMEAALHRAGFTAKWVDGANTARQHLRHTYFEAIVMDCMLPIISGVDFSQELRKTLGEEFLLILTSGIFRDRQFVKESQRKTNAAEFLTKPFDLEQLVSILEKKFANSIGPSQNSLAGLLTNPSLTDLERKAALENSDNIHAFELPSIYALLAQSNLSGHLNLVYADGEVSSLGFHQGEVDQVNVKDSNSYFGVLLVEKGFCSADDVQAGLALKSNKRLGERMVFTNTLSPHAIFIIQLEQMGIRLSKTVKDTSVQVRFLESDNDHGEIKIDRHHLQPMMHDWISTKVSSDWLNTYFVPWMDHPIEIGPNFKEIQKFMKLPLVSHMEALLPQLTSQPTIREILDQSHPENEDYCLRAIHFLLLNESIKLNPRAKGSNNFEARTRRLEKMIQDMENQTHFEILGISREAGTKTVQKAYHDLAKVLHPDKIDKDAPEELKILARNVFAQITKAHEILSSAEERRKYLNELEFGSTENALEAESMFENGYLKLLQGKHKEALEIFTEVKKMKGHRPDIGIYVAWAKMKMGPFVTNQPGFNNQIQMELNKVPPEERHTPYYFFVRGLFYKLTNKPNRAQTLFRNALSLQPDFVQAKKELNQMEKHGMDPLSGPSDGSNMGAVTSIMQGFFGIKKKKSS